MEHELEYQEPWTSLLVQILLERDFTCNRLNLGYEFSGYVAIKHTMMYFFLSYTACLGKLYMVKNVSKYFISGKIS